MRLRREVMTETQPQDSFTVRSRIDGRAFSLAVQATRSLGGLIIQGMEVFVTDRLGHVLGAYVFSDALDPEGIQRISTLIEQGLICTEREFLLELLAVTEAHSCGTWRLSGSSGRSEMPRALPVLPDFDDYADDPYMPWRQSYSRYIAGDVELLARFEIAPWGEFLSVYISEASAEVIPEMSDFKILLPESFERTCAEAFDELLRQRDVFSLAFSTGGYSALLTALGESRLEVFKRTAHDDLKIVSAHLPSYVIPPMLEHTFEDTQVTAALSIGTNEAVFEITSSRGGCSSGISITISSGELFLEFSAAQIRALRDFFFVIASQGKFTKTKGSETIIAFAMRRESSSLPPNIGKDALHMLSLDAAPGPLSLQALGVSVVIKMPELRYFISSDVATLLEHSNMVSLERGIAFTESVLEEVVRGGRFATVGLKRRLVRRRPDLIPYLVFIEHPNGTEHVRVVSGMGGSRDFILRREVVSDRGVLLATRASLCRIFAEQERRGWTAVIRKLLDVSDEIPARGGSVNADLPSLSNVAAIESFQAAANVLAYLLRGAGRSLWGFCKPQDDGSASLSLGSSALAGAVEIRFRGFSVIGIEVRVRSSNPSVLWQTVEHLSHQGYVVDGGQLFRLVTAVRMFMRQQAMGGAEAGVTPALVASRTLVETLAPVGFVDSKVVKG